MANTLRPLVVYYRCWPDFKAFVYLGVTLDLKTTDLYYRMPHRVYKYHHPQLVLDLPNHPSSLSFQSEYLLGPLSINVPADGVAVPGLRRADMLVSIAAILEDLVDGAPVAEGSVDVARVVEMHVSAVSNAATPVHAAPLAAVPMDAEPLLAGPANAAPLSEELPHDLFNLIDGEFPAALDDYDFGELLASFNVEPAAQLDVEAAIEPAAVVEPAVEVGPVCLVEPPLSVRFPHAPSGCHRRRRRRPVIGRAHLRQVVRASVHRMFRGPSSAGFDLP